MNSKKLQHIFFSTLLILSIFSSLYLNHRIEKKNALVELTEITSDKSQVLMADIDAFKHIFHNVAKQIVFN